MKSLYSIMILVICLAPIAHSQVDTLQAIEVGTIQAPSNITQLYVQDLDGDSLKELILCTQNHVYVYNSVDSLPIWTSPELIRPTDLQFADINGDSLLDVSVKDSASISIFDVFSSLIIYSSSTDNLYRCYAVGDVNGDNMCDLLISEQEIFDRSARYDTCWIEYNYGPSFSYSDTNLLLLRNSRSDNPDGGWGEFREFVNKIQFITISIQGIVSNRLCILTDIFSGWYAPGQPSGYGEYSGQIYLIEPQEFLQTFNGKVGLNDTVCTLTRGNDTFLYSISSLSSWGFPGWSARYTNLIAKYSQGSLIDSTTMCRISLFSGQRYYHFYIEDLNSTNAGPEVGFSCGDSLFEYSISNHARLWAIAPAVDSFFMVGVFHSPIILNQPQIILKRILPTPVGYLFIDGRYNGVTTFLPDPPSPISQISDLNNDGNDEILCISGNTLHIYNLEWATPVTERPILPSEYLAVSNYPNPFNGQTIIKYNLPNQCDLALKIYDILGRKIESFEKPNQPAGLGQITWDASGEPSGVYFYRLSAGSEQKTGRMVLLK